MKKEKKFYNMKIYTDPKTVKFEPRYPQYFNAGRCDVYQFIKNPKLTKGDFIIVEDFFGSESVIYLLKFFNYMHSRLYESHVKIMKNKIFIKKNEIRNYDVYYYRHQCYLYCKFRVVCSTNDRYTTNCVILENLAGYAYKNSYKKYHILPKGTTRDAAKIIFELYRQGMIKL